MKEMRNLIFLMALIIMTPLCGNDDFALVVQQGPLYTAQVRSALTKFTRLLEQKQNNLNHQVLPMLKNHVQEGMSGIKKLQNTVTLFEDVHGIMRKTEAVFAHVGTKLEKIVPILEQISQVERESKRKKLALKALVNGQGAEEKLDRLFSVVEGRLIGQCDYRFSTKFGKPYVLLPMLCKIVTEQCHAQSGLVSDIVHDRVRGRGFEKLVPLAKLACNVCDKITSHVLVTTGNVDDVLGNMAQQLYSEPSETAGISEALDKMGDYCLALIPVLNEVRSKEITAQDILGMIDPITLGGFVRPERSIQCVEKVVSWPLGERVIASIAGRKKVEMLRECTQKKCPASKVVRDIHCFIKRYKLEPFADSIKAIIQEHPDGFNSLIRFFEACFDYYQGDLARIGQHLKRMAHHFNSKQQKEELRNSDPVRYLIALARVWGKEGQDDDDENDENFVFYDCEVGSDISPSEYPVGEESGSLQEDGYDSNSEIAESEEEHEASNGSLGQACNAVRQQRQEQLEEQPLYSRVKVVMKRFFTGLLQRLDVLKGDHPTSIASSGIQDRRDVTTKISIFSKVSARAKWIVASLLSYLKYLKI